MTWILTHLGWLLPAAVLVGLPITYLLLEAAVAPLYDSHERPVGDGIAADAQAYLIHLDQERPST